MGFGKETLQKWASQNPRLWWGLQKLDPGDALRDRTISEVLSEEKLSELTLSDLLCFVEALEAYQKASSSGDYQGPPHKGERRSFPAFFTRCFRVQGERFFRVCLFSPWGWGGYLDTTSPSFIESVVSKMRRQEKPAMVVGSVLQQPYECFVVLKGDAKVI